MKTALAVLTAFLFVMVGSVAHAAPGDAILGMWNNEERDAKIEIFGCGNRYCGKIVWINKPYYSADEKDHKEGSSRLDDNNPDPDFRSRPIVGLTIMTGFEYIGDSVWAGGKLYDPKTGRTYSGKMTLKSPDRLNLRGYVLFSLFGKSSYWTRVSP